MIIDVFWGGIFFVEIVTLKGQYFFLPLCNMQWMHFKATFKLNASVYVVYVTYSKPAVRSTINNKDHYLTNHACWRCCINGAIISPFKESPLPVACTDLDHRYHCCYNFVIIAQTHQKVFISLKHLIFGGKWSFFFLQCCHTYTKWHHHTAKCYFHTQKLTNPLIVSLFCHTWIILKASEQKRCQIVFLYYLDMTFSWIPSLALVIGFGRVVVIVK